MQSHNNVVQRSTGSVIPLANVEVYLAGTATVATIYSDNGVTPITRPFLANSEGEFKFWAADGRYDVVATYDGITDSYEIILSDSPVNVRNFGALGDGVTDDTSSFQLAIDSIIDKGIIFLPEGDHIVTVSSLIRGTKTILWDGPGTINGTSVKTLPGLNIGYASGRQIFNKDDSTPGDYADFEFLRNADYTGDDGANSVASNIRVDTTVGANAGSASFTSSEWAINSVIDSSSPDAHSVSVSGVAYRRSTGPVWGGHFNAREETGGTTTINAIRAIEANIQATGADNNNLRSVIDVVAHNIALSYAGLGVDTIAYGLRVYSESADLKKGIQLQENGSSKIYNGIVNSITGNGSGYLDDGTRTGRAIYLTGGGSIGLDSSAGTWTSCAIRIGDDSYIQWRANGAVQTRFNTSTSEFEYIVSGTNRVDFNLSGTPSINLNSTQVIGTRKTGWSAATGTATRTTFVTSTVTLAQLAERVKALIDDSISHGLIGT